MFFLVEDEEKWEAKFWVVKGSRDNTMSSSKVLADRGVAETKHGNMIRKLESVVSQDGPNRRTIQTSLNQIKEA